jgi:copper ion binding protein
MMKSVTFQVPGISCGHCVNTIQMELGEIEGVTSVKADQNSRSVMIEFQDPASESQLINVLEEINYPIQTA